jgi:uncharacterized protein YceK
MRFIYPVIMVSVILGGCSSVSHQTARDLSSAEVANAGEPCARAVKTADVQNEIKWGRIVATPILTVASVGLLPALIGANAALDYSDRKNASSMREACGFAPIDHQSILADVATNAGISVGLGAVDLGLGSDVSSIQDTFSSSGSN